MVQFPYECWQGETQEELTFQFKSEGREKSQCLNSKEVRQTENLIFISLLVLFRHLMRSTHIREEE